MDRQSHYTWTLTRDELNTISDALREAERNYHKQADCWEKQGRYDMAEMCKALAEKRFDLNKQIARLKRLY